MEAKDSTNLCNSTIKISNSFQYYSWKLWLAL